MTYEEQLNDPRWKAKRAEVIDRDFGMCQRCMSSKNLHVHHRFYITGRMAWEYSNVFLETLCGDCHAAEHGIEKEPHDDIKESLKNAFEWGRLLRNLS